MYHKYFDDIGNEIIVNLDYVKALTAYSNNKKKKDLNPLSKTYGEDIESGLRYFIKFEIDINMFKVQAFDDEKERDKIFSKLKKDLFDFKLGAKK